MQVTIKNKNQSFETEDDERILDAALRQGITMPYGCRSGRCGNCMGTLVDGDIDYPNGLPPALTDEDKAMNKALFCQAVAKSDATIDIKIIDTPEGIEPRKMPARVASLEKLADDVIHLKLKIPASERLQFMAGQYVDFILSDGRHRAFSLCNPPHHDEFLEFQIRHVPGGYFTSIVFEELKEKALIRIHGPLGTFYLREDSDAPIIMMGGGTGMAPLRGMLLHLFEVGNTRPVHLFWGVRAQRDLYLSNDIEQWLKDYDWLTFTPVLSDPDGERPWEGETGWVHESVVKHHPDMSAHEVYMSGPPPMIYAAKDVFHEHGLAEDRVYSDAFDFADDPDISAAEKEGNKS